MARFAFLAPGSCFWVTLFAWLTLWLTHDDDLCVQLLTLIQGCTPLFHFEILSSLTYSIYVTVLNPSLCGGQTLVIQIER